MPRRYFPVLFAVAFSLTPAVDLGAGAKSDKKVKISATASKIDADGNQVISVTLDIDKGWHTYANPVGNAELRGAQTQVKVNAKASLGERQDHVSSGNAPFGQGQWRLQGV